MIKHETSELLCDDHFCIAVRCDTHAIGQRDDELCLASLHSLVGPHSLFLAAQDLARGRSDENHRHTAVLSLVQKQEYGSLDL